MSYLLMHLATQVCARIASVLAWKDDGADRTIDDSMAEAWVRQQDRLRKAIAQAKERSKPMKDDEFDDGCVGPWIRQQQRVRDAIAQAKPKHLPAEDTELDDEWVGPWIRQQKRVRDAIAQAKQHGPAAKG